MDWIKKQEAENEVILKRRELSSFKSREFQPQLNKVWTKVKSLIYLTEYKYQLGSLYTNGYATMDATYKPKRYFGFELKLDEEILYLLIASKEPSFIIISEISFDRLSILKDEHLFNLFGWVAFKESLDLIKLPGEMKLVGHYYGNKVIIDWKSADVIESAKSTELLTNLNKSIDNSNYELKLKELEEKKKIEKVKIKNRNKRYLNSFKKLIILAGIISLIYLLTKAGILEW